MEKYKQKKYINMIYGKEIVKNKHKECIFYPKMKKEKLKIIYIIYIRFYRENHFLYHKIYVFS